MDNPASISSRIDVLQALRESKQQVRKELKASKANIKYKVQGIISPAKTVKKNTTRISQIVSNGLAIYEGIRLGMSIISAFRSLFGRRRYRH
ncbi:MAG: hypothetical protein IKH05_08980 [Bacteroidaceae bacterium]|jgi:hypothetical protein|nr:hypothetical protein [Bacteroidaceae bacterium]